MPSISKTTSNTWKVQYYELGKKRNKTFKTKTQARNYVALLELGKTNTDSGLTFKELIIQYRDKVSIKKGGFRFENIRLNALLKRPIAELKLENIDVQVLQDYVEWRATSQSKNGGTIGNATVRREFTIIRAIFSWALKKGYIKENPAIKVKLPPEPEPRERVASDEDLERLRISSGWDGTSVPTTRTQLVILAFHFACRTGMRAGEIMQLEKSWINGNVIKLPKEATKTRTSRTVALSPSAKHLLELAIGYAKNQLKSGRITKIPDRIFYPLNDDNREALFRKVRDMAGLEAVKDSKGRVVKEGLNFHDSRATFATWAASPDPKTGAPRLDVLTLARQTGHKNLKMLQRYYRVSGEEIANRLAKAES